MPTMKFARDGSLSGSSMTRTSQITGPVGISLSYDAPAAGKGILTTRTDGQVGTVTMDAGYPVANHAVLGENIGLFWNVNGVPGFLCCLSVSNITGQAVSFNNAGNKKFGDALPPVNTPIIVGKGVISFIAVGQYLKDVLLGFFSGASVPHGVQFSPGGGTNVGFGSGAADGGAKTVDLVNNIANDGSGVVDTNPFAGFTDRLTSMEFFSGSLGLATINVGMLLSNPYP